MTIDEWWNLTPREARLHFSAHQKRTDQELKKLDVANFILGKYVMYAINAPNKYPKQPITQEAEENDNPDGEMTDSDRARLDALFGALAQKSNNLPTPDAESRQDGSEKPTTQKL